MKIIGLIGGMSWESTVEYYRLINSTVKDRLGGLHSAKCLLYSVDFGEIAEFQHAAKWKECTDIMIDAAIKVQDGGADFIVICTNTMHKMADEIQKRIKIPILHIADVTAKQIIEDGCKRIALLGTRFIMEDSFYKDRLNERFEIDVIVPDDDGRRIIHEIIYDELCLGKIRPTSKKAILSIIDSLVVRGADGIILGCTELPLLISQKDHTVPIYDTTELHAIAAVNFALEP